MDIFDKNLNVARDAIEKWTEQGLSWDEIAKGGPGGLDAWLQTLKTFFNVFISEDEWRDIVDVMKEIYLNGSSAQVSDPNKNLVKIPVSPGSAWVRYKEVLKKNQFSPLSIARIENATQRIISQLSISTSQEEPVRGMVVGNVQSGKTANMAGVIAMAQDFGYNFFIVLTGTIDNLRLQTQKRLVKDLTNGGNYSIQLLEDLSKQSAINLQNINLTDNSNTKYLYVCLKNTTRLNNLIDWLNYDKNKRKNLKILILDDEADQAGVNGANMSKGLITRINNQIKALVFGRKRVKKNNKDDYIESLPYGAMNYIGYTATPYANFLNEANDESLYPCNFIATLKSPGEYIGPQQVFGLDGHYPGLNITNLVSPEEITNISSYDIDNKNLNSFKEAIAWFICTVACFRYWGIHKPVTMLIHTSQKIIQHQIVADKVKEVFKDFKKDPNILWYIGSVYFKQTLKLSKESFLEVMDEFPKDKNIKEYPVFKDIKQYILEILDLQTKHIELNDETGELEYSKAVHLCIDNCSFNKITDDNYAMRIIYPDPDRNAKTLMDTPAFIVVGGATLSRGLTLEGLTTTYFLRTTKTADTLMQMGRWFGYRRGYELLPRLWMSDNVKTQFEFLTILDYDLRECLFTMELNKTSLKEYGPRIDSFPNFKMLQITSKNHQQNSIIITEDFANKTGSTTSFFDNDDIIENNYKKTVDFINKLGPVDRKRVDALKNDYSKGTGLIWFEQSYVDVIEYLASLEFPKHNSKALIDDKDKFIDWFTKQIDNNYLTNFNVILSNNRGGKKNNDFSNVDLRMPTRRKLIKSRYGDDIIDLKMLIDQNDRKMDIDMTGLSLNDINLIKNAKQSTISANAKRNNFGLANVPTLIIYVVDKDSGEGTQPDKDREPLNVKQHLVGYHIYIPYGNNNKQKAKGQDVATVTVNLDFLSRGDVNEDED